MIVYIVFAGNSHCSDVFCDAFTTREKAEELCEDFTRLKYEKLKKLGYEETFEVFSSKIPSPYWVEEYELQ